MDSAGSQPRMLVSDTSGNLYYRSVSSGGGVSGVGDGLGQTSSGISLGDSIPGPGPHSFNSNRYQYLNGFMYSLGGSVNDPVNNPAFRIYNNGDLTAGTTMDSTVNGVGQKGLRYNASLGILQLGGSDHLRHNANSYSGILMNNDVVNQIKGTVNMSYIAGDGITLDTTSNLYISMVLGESHHIGGTGLDQSYLTGFGHNIASGVTYSMLTGFAHTVNKPESQCLNVSGYENATADTARSSIIGGSQNTYGGMYQLEVGNVLVNRTPAGAVLGNGNTDFSTLPYTGLQGVQVPNIGNYPLFALGNSNSNAGAVRSNALTVLFNGRTQINTTGHTAALSQVDVTPKAALDVVSTNTGVLLPRLTTTQRNAIVSGDLQNGLLLYNTDSSAFQYYNGSAWNSVGSGAAGGASGRWQYTSGLQYDTVNSVGIGTSNTLGYKLAVKGSALFTKVKVIAPSDWPDYVFEKDYQLRPLAELEQYIVEHHHLPEINPEDEVRKNGIDLGDHAGAVLKKVEELTLYLINENKQLKEQNAKLEAQQKQIDELKAMILEKNKQH
jgi:hypothetical protein